MSTSLDGASAVGMAAKNGSVRELRPNPYDVIVL